MEEKPRQPSRRAFLRGPLAANRPAPSAPPLPAIGVQLYTVRDEMAKDFEGTLQKVAEIGYAEVEFAGLFGNPPGQVRQMLQAVGLTTPAAHILYEQAVDPNNPVFHEAAELGNNYAVVPFLDEKLRDSLDGYRRVADEFNEAATRARAAGVQFGYHNHAFEFDVLQGRRGLDVLLESTDPTLVTFELDLFWTKSGGGDWRELFERHPGRFPMVHVKDMDSQGQMVDVGAGEIDFAAVFEHKELGGLRHAFVEHDQPGDPLASIRRSYNHLSRVLAANGDHE